MLAANWSGPLRVRGPRGAGLSLQLWSGMGDWRRVATAVLQLSELGTGGVRLLGHQITSPPEQRRVVLLVINKKEKLTRQVVN